MSELIKHVELGQKGEDSPEVTSEFRNLKPSTERPIYSSSVVGGTLGERTVSPGHLVRIRSVADQDKLKGEIEKTSQKIADLKSARMSTGKIIKWALIAAAVVGGIIAVAAGIFAAPLLCCIVGGSCRGIGWCGYRCRFA
ncbi:MAG: hypothetical protein LBF42_01540 [Puniceicoccales bacterium]|jgi:hypothetical protein|nr:hypothetical protein [Puniceicoccales bacterium]